MTDEVPPMIFVAFSILQFGNNNNNYHFVTIYFQDGKVIVWDAFTTNKVK